MAKVWDDVLRQRLSRRRALGAAAATGAGVAGLALVGCGDSGGGGGNGNGGSDTPTKGGILRQRQASALSSISPFGPTALFSTLTFGFTVYDHLWYVPIDTGNVEKLLASEIEIVDAEQLQVNITMQPSFFHNKAPANGRNVLASDVKASWEGFRDDQLSVGRIWLQEIMESLEAPEDLTFVIRQKHPWAWMFGTAGAGSPASSSILPVETISGGQFDLNDDVLGSGRYFLESHDGGANLKFRAFDKWRISGEPFLGGIDAILLTDFSSAESQFAARNLDSIGFQNKLQADQMQSRIGEEMNVVTDLSRDYNVLQLQQKPPFDNPDVRKAINLAINRADLIALTEADPAGGVNCGIVPPAQEIYALPQDDPDMVEFFRHNAGEARALLEGADFPFDDEFELTYPTPSEPLANMAQVLKDQLSDVGVNVRITPIELANWFVRAILDGDFTLNLFTHLAYEDPYLPLAFYTAKSPIGKQEADGRRNNMNYFDQEITDSAETAALEMELEARIDKVKDTQRLILSKNPPMINLYSNVNFTGRWNWYKGQVDGRGSFGLFNGKAWIDTTLRTD